ncbi:MAG: LysR family transcriptional regulator [Pseudomonadota bacterium]
MAKTLDRFDLLRLFLRIAETGSLSGAARALGLSQPSASRQLRMLEEDLGATLLRRSTHELALTEEGERLLPEARALLDGWEGVRERIGGAEGALEGRIRVLAPAGLGQTLLADAAAGFLAHNPGVRLEWLLDDAPRDLVAEGIDLWLRIGPVADEGLILRPLATIPRVLVAQPVQGCAAGPEALETRGAVVLSPFASGGIVLTGPGGERVTVLPRCVVETDNLFAAARFVGAGIGYGLLPLWLVRPDLERGDLLRLCPGWQAAPIVLSLAYPRLRFRPRRVAALIGALREAVAAMDLGRA